MSTLQTLASYSFSECVFCVKQCPRQWEDDEGRERELIIIHSSSVILQKKIFKIMYMCVPMWGYVHLRAGTHRSQKRVSALLELGLQVLYTLYT